MTAAERYAMLESLMLRARALGTATETQLDAILDDMDAQWDAMSEAERSAADAHARALTAIPAPDELALVDIPRAAGDHDLPRRVA